MDAYQEPLLDDAVDIVAAMLLDYIEQERAKPKEENNETIVESA